MEIETENVMEGVRLVTAALGKDMEKHLVVSPSENLTCDDEWESFTVKVEPMDADVFDHKPAFIQIDYNVNDDEYYMVFGEDNQADITRGNVFEWLYYSAVCRAEF